MKSIWLTLLFILATFSNSSYGKDKVPELKGPYVGQETPGLTPKIFAPAGRSTAYRDHSGFFSPDMSAFYFTRRDTADKKWTLRSFKLKDNQWHEAEVVPRIRRPIFSTDGKIMHLGERYIERTQTGWSEVKSLGEPFEKFRIMRLMSTSNGTYYFDEATESSPIRYSRLVNGKYEEPKPVEINFGDWNAHPYVAPDESYLIWDEQNERGFGGADLYIAFKQQDGSWTSPINFGDKINTHASENAAIVTPDGKYLLFNRYINEENAGMMWVDAKIIETLRPKTK